MSFGSGSDGLQLKKFESQGEVDEKRRKRQEEWEKVRKPEDPIEAPEEETRSLWQQLQDNQDAKNQEFEEQQKLRNSVKGLEDEEVKFLEHVSDRQVALERERAKEETALFQQLKEAAVKRVTEKSPPADGGKKPALSSSSSSSTPAAAAGGSKKSQQSLLLGAIKRKSTEAPVTAEESSKRKRSETNDNNNAAAADPDTGINTAADDKALMSLVDPSLPQAHVAGVLPGIGHYGNDSSDSDSSSAESDIVDYLKPRKTIVYVTKGGN